MVQTAARAALPSWDDSPAIHAWVPGMGPKFWTLLRLFLVWEFEVIVGPVVGTWYIDVGMQGFHLRDLQIGSSFCVSLQFGGLHNYGP